MHTQRFFSICLATACLAACICAAQEQTDDHGFPAAASAGVEATAEQTVAIQKLIVQLGDDDFSTRQAAQSALQKFGSAANALLRKAAAESTDAETRETSGRLLRQNETEIWEGYYYYSLGTFENAVDTGVVCVRFWFRVTRGDNCDFHAECDEEDTNLGKSEITGHVDVKTGEFNFYKQYNEKATHGWKYEGKWNADKGRVDGTYGPNSGGFVLYPRPLTDSEKKNAQKN